MFKDRIDVMNQHLNDSENISGFEKRVYTVEEIMDILDIGKNTAYALVNSGVFHFVKVGGHYRISKKSFDNWLDNIDSKNSDCQVSD
ncbi:helix-turn-helix domain-containing protein [Anaerofustis butyriciformans]|uniref:helix-turn-helix domain-containing protein n=1 Tax=Anaerofustis butyriciformans TaxID=3108533 RepID=UPI002E32E876|nr:helix-turn-helix domain-containing protein [Anaerofustis sp. HA2171]